MQEKSKLTLRLNKRLVEQARQYAARHGISLSELVEAFFLRLEDTDEEAHTPLVRLLTGILPEMVDVEQACADHLVARHSSPDG